ncbi:MAG: hypothetical protein QOH36_1595 [Actinomycetota bacterium]|nr:hypothetical protein [Actinomycetota bacterium]
MAGGAEATSGLLTAVGCVADVNVTLRGVTHPSPADLDVALEAPGGGAVPLMTGAVGAVPVDGVDLTFDDEARATAPTGGAWTTGTYRPAAPLSAFDRTPAAGQWTLRVTDRGSAGGTIAGGWSLAVTACGQSRPAVVRDSSDWYLRDSLSTGEPTTLLTFGTKPLTPLFGDWDGDGTASPGTFERGVFRLSNGEGTPPTTFSFGDERGFGLAGDFDGDGRDDVAVFRDGTWEIRHAADGTVARASFGTGAWPATVPLAGDWDGDGTDGIGTWSAGTWSLRDTPAGNGPPDHTFTLGPVSGAYPVVGDWAGTADTRDAPGYVQGSTWTVFWDDPFNLGTRYSVLKTFAYGQPGDLPLAGP